MPSTSRYAFQSPSVSNEKGAYRMRPPRSSRPGSNLRHSSDPSSHTYIHVPYRRARRLVMLVAFLACATLACFACAYWLFTTRYGHLTPPRTASGERDASSAASYVPYQDAAISHQLDITLDILDEPDARLNALRVDPTTAYLAYLPHSGLHNQRIALENAVTLARLLNRTLLVPPARLGPKMLRYVRSKTLARMLQLSDKRRGRVHCAYIPADVPRPDECVDYSAYTLVPWTWLVDFGPIEATQAIVRVSNGTTAWMEERLGIRPNETLFLPDTEPYEYQFVDTLAPGREGNKYLHSVPIENLISAPQRLIQLGTLFGSSRLRLRKAENRRVRGEVRRHMVFANAGLNSAVEKICEALGRTYVGVHVRVGDGQFETGAQANVRLVWWKLVRDVLGVDEETTLDLERRVLSTTGGVGYDQESDGDEDEVDMNDMVRPPQIPVDIASLRVPHPALPPLADVFMPQTSCRRQLHTLPSLYRLNVPVFVATDARYGLDDPLLARLLRTFPCAFSLASFEAEMEHLNGIRNGYDRVRLGEFVAPIVEAMVMGRAWAIVGTEGSTFSRYVGDVLWREWHGWDIVERG